MKKNIHYVSLFEKYIYVKLEPLDGFALIIARQFHAKVVLGLRLLQGPALLCILIMENSSKHDILTKISCTKCYVLYIGAFLFLLVVNTVYCENFSEKRYTQQLSVSLKLSLLKTLQCLCGTHGFFCGLFNYSHLHQIWSGLVDSSGSI